nr:uncharacterized protein LOC112028598 [Quercus suber]
MSAISWNCRGLGNPLTVKALQKVVLEKDPTLVFLMETKFDVTEMDGVKQKIERQQGLVVPSVRRAGGLALLWKNSLQVDILSYSPGHIDAIVSEEQGLKKWRFTRFYGHPETRKRGESWTLLENLSSRNQLPWVCMGDFNEILFAKEKVGGGVRPEGQMRCFRETINSCRLRDLGYVGSNYTWSRRLGKRGWVRERLDRALVSTDWAGVFPLVKLYHLSNSILDHSILLLKETSFPRQQKWQSKLFRFESMWLENERCKNVVLEAWERGCTSHSQWPLEACLEECQTSLRDWNKNIFGHVGKQVADLQKKLQMLEAMKYTATSMDEIHATKMELNRWLGIEEEMWRQRSRNNWLKAGDRNTTFFHTKASNRYQRNTINRLMDVDTGWIEDGDQIGQKFVSYFEELFTTSRLKVEQEMLDAIQPKVTERMNYTLTQDFHAMEVEKALKQMHPLTAPGLDASKVVANRMKLVLQEIIGENQSAFVAKRLITDNILVAHELMTHISKKKKGKCGEMAIKLDMSKAYDRVEWECLKQIMKKLGFHEKWIDAVMQCVSSVKYAVRINRQPYGLIQPTRGLRQGDPLSPYLFLICSEGLSALLNHAAQRKTIEGVAASSNGPRVSHLLFADDNLVFGRATVYEATEIQRILKVYKTSSSQQLNCHKTSLFFSPNTENKVKEMVKTMFGAQVIRPHEAYLGLPSLVGRSKNNTFAHLKQRVTNKVSGWKEKLLTPVGKEILIKSVAQAVPSYTISCFLLPKNLCEELTSVIRQFWWGQTGNEKKTAWLSWDAMCVPKDRGGLGFRDLRSFNLAFLAKQGWRILTNSNSLFSRVYKAKYFPHCNFAEATMGRSPSYAWRSLMAAQSIVQRGMRWQVRNGNKIRVWHDKWIPRPCTYKVISKEKPNSANALVCELINKGTGEWNIDKLNSWFLPDDKDTIMGILLSSSNANDRLVWAKNRSGKFTIKSAYALALEEKTQNTMAGCSNESARRKIWKTIWQMRIPQKIKHFAWRAGRDILATKANLAKQRITPNGLCDLCGNYEETVYHLLWGCDHAREVWKNSKFALPFEHSRPGQMEKFISVCWSIWKDINVLRTSGNGKAGSMILRSATHLVEEFWLANEEKTEYQAVLVHLASWQPPRQGCYKVNMDGMVFRSSKQAGAGVIIRDGADEVIAALSKKWKCPLGAIEAEAKALEAGINFVWEVGIREAEFEMDSLMICNALHGLESPPSSIVNVLAGVRHQVSSFRQWKFTHIKKQGNVPAHLLAQLARNVEDCVAFVLGMS